MGEGKFLTMSTSMGNSNGKNIFLGAYNGSNEAYSTLRCALVHLFKHADHQHVKLDLDQVSLSSLMRPFVLVAITFKGASTFRGTRNAKKDEVRSCGMSILDSNYPVLPDNKIEAPS
jgi:hypothetical protein